MSSSENFYTEASKCPYVQKISKECPFIQQQVAACPFLQKKQNEQNQPIPNNESLQPLTMDVTSQGLLVPNVLDLSNNKTEKTQSPEEFYKHSRR